MNFGNFLDLVSEDPTFETSLLLAGEVNPAGVRLQISRWVKSGRIQKLRRGLYALAPPYRKVTPHPFVIANRLQRASYVSLQSALAFHGLISEVVNTVTSITAGRPERVETPLGLFEFRHIKPGLLSGYQITDLGGQQALMAMPGKALLDLIYLTPGGGSMEYLQALRLQNLDRLDVDLLKKQAAAFGSPKLRTAARRISLLAQNEMQEYEAQ